MCPIRLFVYCASMRKIYKRKIVNIDFHYGGNNYYDNDDANNKNGEEKEMKMQNG